MSSGRDGPRAGSGIRLPPIPEIKPDALRALVAAIRDLLEGSRFHTFDELGQQLRPRRTRQRLSELARGTRLPDAEELRAVVEACRASEWPRLRWLLRDAENERVAAAAAPVPWLSDFAVTGRAQDRLPLVAEYRQWARLGVHRPITQVRSGEDLVDLTEQVDAGELPAYVVREKDLEPRTGLRPVLAEMATGTGPPVRLVLVTGESLAGKTRAAVEAMRAELPSWRLLIPRSAARLGRLLDEHLDLRRTVVWLDEIQEFLDQDTGVEQVDRLLDLPGGPIVLLATLRTDAEASLRGKPAWRLLTRRAHRIILHRRPPRAGLDRELARARQIDDPWIPEAAVMSELGYGIAEWLGAGPQIVIKLDQARASDDPIDRAGAAIVDAAVACNRAGYTAPIPAPLLNEVGRLYLPEPFGPLDAEMFTAGLTWARRAVDGATGLLVHHRGRGDVGYDYLLGRTGTEPIRTEIWDLVLRHATPATLTTIAKAAANAGQQHVVATARARADHGRDGAELLYLIGDLEELTNRAAEGNRDASRCLADLLADLGDTDELTRRADAEDWDAGHRLAKLLVDRDDEEELRRRDDQGDSHASLGLIDLLVIRGDVEGLTRIADATNGLHAQDCLANMLADRGDVETLGRRAEAGDDVAARRLSWALFERGDEQELARRVEADDTYSVERLADLRRDQVDLDDLIRRYKAGDLYARDALVGLLARRGDLAGLTHIADSGDIVAADRLAHLLADRGDEQTLRSRALMGDRWAAYRLADIYAQRGDESGLSHLAELGYQDAKNHLAELRTARGGVARPEPPPSDSPS